VLVLELACVCVDVSVHGGGYVVVVALGAVVLVYEEVEGRVGPLGHVEVGVAWMHGACVVVCVVEQI
jgi:hypothetical protein